MQDEHCIANNIITNITSGRKHEKFTKQMNFSSIMNGRLLQTLLMHRTIRMMNENFWFKATVGCISWFRNFSIKTSDDPNPVIVEIEIIINFTGIIATREHFNSTNVAVVASSSSSSCSTVKHDSFSVRNEYNSSPMFAHISVGWRGFLECPVSFAMQDDEWDECKNMQTAFNEKISS